jgi:hypothetical protein
LKLVVRNSKHSDLHLQFIEQWYIKVNLIKNLSKMWWIGNSHER